MSWLLFAFSGPVFWALSTHVDKYLVERYFKEGSVAVLLVFTALIGLLLLPFVGYYQPGAFKIPLVDILVIAASGALYMSAMFFYLQALQSEEASVVAPFFQTSPLFAYALAYLFLGEFLSGGQLLGGALIILGAFIISIRGGSKARFNSRLALLMLACSFLLALSSVLFKFFAIQDEFWTTIFWTYAGEAVFGFVLLAIPSCWRQLRAMLRANTGAVLAVNGANELINLAGNLGVGYAMLLAPIALVRAISSTTLLFIFVFGVLLTLFAPSLGREDLSPRNLLRKGLAAVLVGAGVLLISH